MHFNGSFDVNWLPGEALGLEIATLGSMRNVYSAPAGPGNPWRKKNCHFSLHDAAPGSGGQGRMP
jgi:hypothetical protein